MYATRKKANNQRNEIDVYTFVGADGCEAVGGVTTS
jgi:hypothetical protein